MTVAVLTALIAVAVFFVYLKREQLGRAGAGMAALRTAGVGALLLLVVNPGTVAREEGGVPLVLLDASLSMGVEGGDWEGAVDTARVLAGSDGRILRFGDGVEEFDGTAPGDGASRLSEALRAAVAIGGSIYVVSDGEIDDYGAIPLGILDNVEFVTMARDTVVDVALLNVDVPRRAVEDDSIRVGLTLGTWGGNTAISANVSVFVGDRELARWNVDLPPSPGVARRTLFLPPRVLSEGEHVLSFRLTADGDEIQGDNERLRVIRVAQNPDVVVVLDPPDWEGRFLTAEFGEILRANVQAYAHVLPDMWMDMTTLTPIPLEVVQRASRQSALLVLRGADEAVLDLAARRLPVWHWPAASVRGAGRLDGDWYLSSPTTASPLAGRLASVRWDSVPPLSSVISLPPDSRRWMVISAQQGRRGLERPVLVGSDFGGVRQLTTTGDGLWRWRFRGGAAREAYRTVIAAGADWLLGPDAFTGGALLVSTEVVRHGEPVYFRWTRADSVPDSLVVTFTREGSEETFPTTLRFDGEGIATHFLPNGRYRWLTQDAGIVRGIAVVESYSDEYHPRAVVSARSASSRGVSLVDRYARHHWWLFLIVIVALSGEWALRQRRGLP